MKMESVTRSDAGAGGRPRLSDRPLSGAFLLVAAVLGVMILALHASPPPAATDAGPDEVPESIYLAANPELSAARRHAATQSVANDSAFLAANPELSAHRRYATARAGGGESIRSALPQSNR